MTKRPHRGGFEEAESFSGTSKRVIDEEAEVVLYGAGVGSAFTITAVPLKDTALELPEKSEE